MKMEFAVGMGRNERMDEIADHARVAEESGFSFITYVDQPYISRDCTPPGASASGFRLPGMIVRILLLANF